MVDSVNALIFSERRATTEDKHEQQKISVVTAHKIVHDELAFLGCHCFSPGWCKGSCWLKSCGYHPSVSFGNNCHIRPDSGSFDFYVFGPSQRNYALNQAFKRWLTEEHYENMTKTTAKIFLGGRNTKPSFFWWREIDCKEWTFSKSCFLVKCNQYIRKFTFFYWMTDI